MDNATARYERHRRSFFYFLVGGILTLLAFGLFRLLFPFVLAWLLALLLQPAVRKLTRVTGFSRSAVGLLLLAVTVVAGGGGIVWLCGRLATELPQIAEGLSDAAARLAEQTERFSANLRSRLPFLSVLPEEKWKELGGELLNEGVGKLSAWLTSLAGSVLVSLPGGVFVTVIFLMAAFYLIVDFEKVSGYLSSLLPRKAIRRLGGLRRQLFTTTLSYLRAYLILLAVTFGELVTAFLLLGIRYAITLALLIALLDALPALGVGTVLLPWALVEFLMGDWKRGIWLCVVWAVVTLVRQLLEPRVVGAQLGLHPLAALCAVWVGFRILGVWGLLFAPVLAILLRGVLEDWQGRLAQQNQS